MKNKIEINAKCDSCNGTGLYKGMAEKDGFAIVCYDCNGAGHRKIIVEWEDFCKREIRKDVKRVLQTNPGIVVGESKKDGLTLESFGGMDYRDWLKNGIFPPGSEMRKFVCPARWYQSINCENKPDWQNQEDGINCIKFGAFSQCENFSEKQECWTKWDKEFNK